MMSTSNTLDIQKIAELAKLHVSSEKLNAITKDLHNILNFVNKMDRQDTKNTKPLAHPIDVAQPLRADQVTEHNQRDLFQQNAPQAMAGLYIVPKFIETES